VGFSVAIYCLLFVFLTELLRGSTDRNKNDLENKNETLCKHSFCGYYELKIKQQVSLSLVLLVTVVCGQSWLSLVRPKFNRGSCVPSEFPSGSGQNICGPFYFPVFSLRLT
jgi:hypothetical protein